jgi:hypothetical protein
MSSLESQRYKYIYIFIMKILALLRFLFKEEVDSGGGTGSI